MRHVCPPHERKSLSWMKLNTQFQIACLNTQFQIACFIWWRPAATTAAANIDKRRERVTEHRRGRRKKKKRLVGSYKGLNTRFEIACLNTRFEITCSTLANSNFSAHVADTRDAQLASIEPFL